MTTPAVQDGVLDTIFALAKDWSARFPDLADPWIHQSEDGTRIWLTDGRDGPVLAMHTLPATEEDTAP
jgi:hypothetical protein